MTTGGVCLGSGASMGGVQGGRARGRTAICPVCGRRIALRPGRAGRLYPHHARIGASTEEADERQTRPDLEPGA